MIEAANKPFTFSTLVHEVPILVILGLGVASVQSFGGETWLVVTGILAVGILACTNGANDLPKAVATLVGSGEFAYGTALIIGTAATVLGGAVSILLASTLLSIFSAGGITSTETAAFPAFPLAVAGGAAAWVVFATRAGLPVSTTHALVGASVGAALLAGGLGSVRWMSLVLTVAIPLLLSPLLGTLVGAAAGWVARRKSQGTWAQAQRELHWLTAAGVGAARALNDTPKIAGVGLLVLSSGHFSTSSSSMQFWVIGLTVIAMAAGGLWASRRVTRTLGFRLVPLDSHSGVATNCTTLALVGTASVFGLPLSTTHVSGAALVGAAGHGFAGTVRWRVVEDILRAWVVTIPGAALLSAAFLVIVTVLSNLV